MSRVRARHRSLRLYSGYVLVLSDIEDASDTSVDQSVNGGLRRYGGA